MDQRSPNCFSLLWRVIPCKGCRSICSLITSPAACVGSSRPSSRASSGSSPVGQELGVLYHCRGGSVSKRIDVSRQSIYKVHLQPSYPSVFLTSCQVEGRRWWTWVVSWADILPGVVGWRAWAYRSMTVSGKGRRKLSDTWRGFGKIDLPPLFKTTISTLEMKWRGIHKGLLILQEEWWGEIDGQQPGLFKKIKIFSFRYGKVQLSIILSYFVTLSSDDVM